MCPSALQKMVAGERLPRNILPDVVSEAENVPGMGKHLVYPGGCSCFPSQECSWRYSSGETWWIYWQMHQMPSAPDASNAGPWQWGSHEPLTSPPCCLAWQAGAGAACFQGAASGAEIYAVFDKKKICFSSSCLQLACCGEAAAVRLLVIQAPTFQFGSGDRVPRDAGNSPCSRTEYLLKIRFFYKNDSDFFKAVAAA